MFRKKKVIGLVGLILTAAFITATASYTNTNIPRKSEAEQMQQSRAWAQIDSAPTTCDTAVFMAGKTIRVYEDEVNRITQKYAAADVENGEELALAYILRREALYNAGLANGFTASDEELQAVIQQNEEMSKDSDGKEYFDEYLKAAGMTEHEYWVSLSDKLKKEIVIGKYLSAEKAAHSFDSTEEWENYEKELVNKLIADDGIKYNY